MKDKVSAQQPSAVSEVRLIKIQEVLAISGKSRSNLYAAVREGTFPRPVKISVRSSAWVRSEVVAWVEARMKAR